MKKNMLNISDFVKVLTIYDVVLNLTNNVIKRRKEHKITQKELARITGVSYGSIKRFESKGEISLHSLLKIANALDCLNDFMFLFKTPFIKDLKDEWKD